LAEGMTNKDFYVVAILRKPEVERGEVGAVADP
jgi:hypothetical protein